ncbi:hypothetical protein OKE80_07430 [Riemerella anatipestifer]|uniref:hypothetical protein n=1 Tax=Riemerella anatipestifer TaxID=34085 RepID=UPI0012ADE9B8|nr:hypothetical protein [Riemerella anatipestifer]MCO7319137.1 hypothetical protein [Riemerella anatipestifer]MCQ4155421.1 hypothetical protein [Riemerella anatipestifer]MCQ4181373.1 hypothetical protein [Riemerella anatipestifer]MCW0474652.1 hypothetical protein [Riemerella anatipestifer]MDR7775500.1 hypothetical protein [Riemerella anatipestifer]
MKKLLLVAMLGVAGIMSAKGKQVKNVQNLQQAKELVISCEAVDCGNNCIELNCTVRRK